MAIRDIRRWQWLLISLLVGAGLAWAHRIDGDLIARFGVALNDQERFERR